MYLKKCNGTARVFKNCSNWLQHTKTAKSKKYIFWINAHPPIEEQSNEDWNTLIHLENNGASIKVRLMFWFLIMTFNLFFITNLTLNGYVYISEKVRDILDNLMNYCRNNCGCLTLNEMHIKLASLMIFYLK